MCIIILTQTGWIRNIFLTCRLVSPWRSLTLSGLRMWSPQSSPFPPSSSRYQSWHSCAGSSIWSNPAQKQVRITSFTVSLQCGWGGQQSLVALRGKTQRWMVWSWEGERKTEKTKGLHLKVFYLCALGSSRLTSPEKKCDLNTALRLLYFTVTLFNQTADRLTTVKETTVYTDNSLFFLQFYLRITLMIKMSEASLMLKLHHSGVKLRQSCIFTNLAKLFSSESLSSIATSFHTILEY